MKKSYIWINEVDAIILREVLTSVSLGLNDEAMDYLYNDIAVPDDLVEVMNCCTRITNSINKKFKFGIDSKELKDWEDCPF